MLSETEDSDVLLSLQWLADADVSSFFIMASLHLRQLLPQCHTERTLLYQIKLLP
jgi:hypothetical protein